MVTVGCFAETLAAAAAATLAVVGLAGLLPGMLAAIGTVVLGSALLAHGGVVGARWKALVRELRAKDVDWTDLRAGVAAELLGGLLAIAAGVLAAVGIRPLLLLPAGSIVFGITLIGSTLAQPALGELGLRATEDERRRATELVQTSAGVGLIIGLGAAVFGAVALTGHGPAITLSLLAILGAGGATLLTGSVTGARLAHSRGGG
jgi:hypothetical protein